ncbi:MAG: hypothetical protein H5T62_16625 [Anaerolineae bacterium]|nr:hypothetical protein [Anaerolineae bacterium]
MSITLGIVVAGLCFLAIFLSGIRLSRSGKPYGTLILTIHKLLSLAALVLLLIAIYQKKQAVALSAVELIGGVVTGLFFIGCIISGGLLSTGKPMPTAILRLHQMTSPLSMLSTAVTLYLLLGRW